MFFGPLSDPKDSAIGPKKAQNDPKIRQIQDQGIELLLENKSCLFIYINPKSFFGHYPTPKKAH